jgi:hypothetical protein
VSSGLRGEEAGGGCLMASAMFFQRGAASAHCLLHNGHCAGRVEAMGAGMTSSVIFGVCGRFL